MSERANTLTEVTAGSDTGFTILIATGENGREEHCTVVRSQEKWAGGALRLGP